jgi:hypothetical protein
MRQPVVSSASSLILLVLALGACGQIKDTKPAETAQTRAEAKRHKDACASNTAYDRMKRVIFDQARVQRNSQRTTLDTLESFSFVRMDGPVVDGWDPALDLTRCKGRFILDVPPGSEQALGGERRLTADIAYTAQGAADASGLVYVIKGAEPIVRKLAAFNLADANYRPLPALDAEPPAAEVARADVQPPPVLRPVAPPPKDNAAPDTPVVPRVAQPERPAPTMKREVPPAPSNSRRDDDIGTAAEETVRSFYNALGTGSGEVASAQVIPAKRTSRAYSADAISRFYGRLSDPLRLTSIRPLPDGSYRVTYRYAGAGIRCNGSATVRLTSGDSRPLIRSIAAGNGC